MKSRSALVSLLLVVVLGAASLVLLRPTSPERLTEFYLLDRTENDGLAATVGQPLSLHVGIGNREGQSGRYRVEAQMGGAAVAQTDSLTIAASADGNATLTFSPTKAGNHQRLDLLLFAGDGSAPYRRLHLWLDVKEAA